MSRKADCTLLVLAALEEARRNGQFRSPPIMSDFTMAHVAVLRNQIERPSRTEVRIAVRAIARLGLMVPEDEGGFVEIACGVFDCRKRRCALLDELWGVDGRFTVWLERNGGYHTAEVSLVHMHHVWGGKTRDDERSNLLPLCAIVHEWVHTVEPVAGRLACIWKRMNLPGFDWSELDRCAGQNVRGWVESHPVEHEPFRSWRDEILSTEAIDACAYSPS